MKKKTVAVFFGGQSSEHDISCLSAVTVVSGIDRERYDVVLVGVTREGRWLLVEKPEDIRDGNWRLSGTNAWFLPDAEACCLLTRRGEGDMDRIPVAVAFPVFHGRFGEDGTIQGLFELAKVPYVGCGVTASAVSMDKLYTKILADTVGVAQARYVGLTQAEVRNTDEAVRKVEAVLKYPIFVKPTDGGSSQGVSRVDKREQLPAALELAASEGTRVLVEEAISGREVECAVLSTPEGPVVSGVGEIRAAAEFYDFEAKYTNPASETDTHPVFPEGKEDEIRDAAVKIFKAVGGHGLSRVDFFLEHGTNRVVFNEINTLPGFTSISMYPMLWKAADMSLTELIGKLIESAFYRR